MKLSVSHVSKCYGKGHALWALRDVSFSVESGEFCAVVGESGSGKSTLTQIVTGLLPATSGEVRLDEVIVDPVSRRKNRNLCAGVQLVLQDGKSALDPHFTVYQSIAEPLRNLCVMTREGEKARVLELMMQMELEESLLTRKPHELSGGQQKRVCIARALATKPEVLIFDEAISGLDVLLRKTILDFIKELHAEMGFTVLFITHDVDVALYMASRILVMKEGEILEDVKNSGGYQCLQHPYSRMLTTAMRPQINIPAEKA